MLARWSDKGNFESIFQNKDIEISDDTRGAFEKISHMESLPKSAKAWENVAKNIGVADDNLKAFLASEDEAYQTKDLATYTQYLKNQNKTLDLAAVKTKALAFAKNMLTNVAIGLAMYGVNLLIKQFDKWIVTTEESREALANLKSECQTIESDLKATNDELEVTRQRMDELEGKGTLTFTEKEEYDNLVKQNNELQRTIDLLKLEQKEKNKEKNKTFVETMEKDVQEGGEKYDNHYGYINEQGYINVQFEKYQDNLAKMAELDAQYKDDLSNKQYQKDRKRLEDQNKKISEYLRDKNTEFTTDADGIEYIENPSNEDEEKVNKWLDFINDFQDRMAIAMGGDNAETNAFNRVVDNWQFDEVVQGLQDSGKEGKVTADMLNDPKYDEFIQKLVYLGIIDSADNLDEIALAFNNVGTEAESSSGNVDKMTVSLSELEKTSDNIKTLSSAFKELSDDGYITTKTLGEIKTATGLADDEWEEYKTRLLSAKKGSSDFNQVMSDLTYKILDATFKKEGLVDATEDEIAAVLRENGVSNASAVAHDYLARTISSEEKAKAENSIRTRLLSGDIAGLIKNLSSEATACGLTETAFKNLAIQMVLTNETNMSFDDQIANLKALGVAAEITAAKMAGVNGYRNIKYSEKRNARGNMDSRGGLITSVGQETINGSTYIVYYGENGQIVDKEKIGADYDNLTTPKIPTYTSDGKSGSDKNTPDYEDPTDAIINRINLRSKELEQQEESIQNAIEIAELEKDHRKQISLTNDLINTRRKRVEELNKANTGLHNEAEYLRNSNPWDEESWFDSQGNATEAYYALYNSSSKADQEKIKNVFEAISKIKKAWIKNSEEIASLTTQVYKDEMETIPNLWEEFVDDKISDIERNIELRNNIGGGNYSATISDYEKIQELAHQRANDWRAAGFDEDFEEIQKWQKVWWDFENRKRDTYREQHENAIRDIEHARDMALEANPSVNTISYYKQMQEEYHKEAERLRALDPEKYKEEIQELQKKWWDAENTIVDNERQKFINAMEKILSAKEKEYEREKEILSLKLDKNNSRQSVLKSYYNVINAIKQAHHEINKELSASKSMYEYLDEESKKLLFNQSDYNALSKKLNSIQGEALELQQRYKVALKNASEETLPKITSEYQMQYETLMKSYEIAKADLEIAKKKQKLNNVLNERNVKMFINGRWTQVANIQDVIDAQSELAEAEYAKQQADTSLKQSKELNELQTKQDELSMQMKFIDKDISDWRKRWNELQEQIKNEQTDIYQSLDNLATSGIPALEKIIVSLGEPLADLYKDITGESLDVPIYKGLPVVGDYKYEKITPHAEGTRKTRLETAIMGEKGFEAYIKSSGELYPLSQPTIGKVNPGGIVFNREQLEGVRALWDMSHYGKATIENINKTVSSNSNHHIVDNSITINGVSISEQGNEDLLNGLRRFASTYKYS